MACALKLLALSLLLPSLCWARGSADFDGTSDNISVSDSTDFDFGTTEAIAISVWAKFDGAITSNYRIINQGSGASFKGWDIHYNTTNDAIRMVIGDGSGNFCTIDGATNPVDGAWHHIGAVFQRSAACTTSTYKLYLDGIEESMTTIATTANSNVDTDTTADVVIGEASGGGQSMNGQINHLQLYKGKTITQAEFQQLMHHPGWELGSISEYWPMDTSGDLGNGLINGHDGTVNGNTTHSTNEPADIFAGGASLDFDGGDYISAADSASLDLSNTFSISFWVDFDIVTGTHWLVGKTDFGASKRTYHLSFDATGTDAIEAAVSGDGSATAGQLAFYEWQHTPATNTWIHYLLTYNSGNSATDRFELYKDGVNQTTTVTNDNAITPFNNDIPLAIGASRSSGSYSSFFDGTMRDVVIWDGVELSQAYATSLATGTDPRKIEPGSIVGLYRFDGRDFWDYSGDGNHGQFNTAASRPSVSYDGPPVSY